MVPCADCYRATGVLQERSTSICSDKKPTENGSISCYEISATVDQYTKQTIVDIVLTTLESRKDMTV
jgi:hypothetical protein